MQQENTGRRKTWIIVTVAAVLVAALAAIIAVVLLQLPEESQASSQTAQAGMGTTAAPTAVPAAVSQSIVPAFPVSSSTMQLTDVQRNSVNMLNHLVVLTQEIVTARDSRLRLEDAYMDLVNNTAPNAVNVQASAQLDRLLEQLHALQILDVKRSRLDYILEKDKARAIREAMAEGVQEGKKNKELPVAATIAVVVVRTAMEATNRLEEAELSYMQDNWALDDEEMQIVHELRKDAFLYTVGVTREYQLDDRFSLTEQAIDEFVANKNKTNTASKIQFFEANQATYEFYGPYWLTLAECYYENGDYLKCLRAITTYETLNIRIYRRDYALARVLPLGVAAAEQALGGDQYAETAVRYADMIMANTGNDDWALRYFAAYTYHDVYARTQDAAQLRKAYDAALNNVNRLVEEQKQLNADYLSAEQQGQTGYIDASTGEIAGAADRRKALPEVCEPLVLNCELLLDLADEMDVDDAERRRLDSILHEDGGTLFLNPAMDDLFRLTGDGTVRLPAPEGIDFRNWEVVVPAQYACDRTVIRLTITNGTDTTVFDDWQIDRVDRGGGTDLAAFTAVYKSAALGQYVSQANSQVTLEVTSCSDPDTGTVTAHFQLLPYKELLFLDRVYIERVPQ